LPDYIQITFSDIQPEQQDWIIAHLAEIAYEGFEQGDQELKAFIPALQYDKRLLKELVFKYQLNYTEEKIDAQNWNAVWESNFQPVIVDDFVAVRADFHAAIPGITHDVVITPKMSFGTGHHATTYMMMREMKSIDFTGKTVFDFGTGTGILAILADKLGAAKIIAIDNDDWSIENATENIQRNHCVHIDCYKADAISGDWKADVILANINKNVILAHLPELAERLAVDGTLLVSGILKENEEEMARAAGSVMLTPAGKAEKDNWLCLKYIH
jgi:ribosomal protein L11 methyltransferase